METVKRVKITNIQWDTEGHKDLFLPENVVIKLVGNVTILPNDSEFEEIVNDYLADNYGWCNKGWTFEEI
jgi:hypothetical protein